MPSDRWERIWQEKGTGGPGTVQLAGDAALLRALGLGGYLTNTAQVTPDAWSAYVQAIAREMALRPGDRVFEVGCGAGAFLMPLRAFGCATNGVDYSPGLVAAARQALPGGQFEVGEARKVDTAEKYDVVLSNGVFLYFPDFDYAAEVLDRMVRKSLRYTAVLDVSDAARKRGGARPSPREL